MTSLSTGEDDKKRAKELSHEILDLTKSLYKANFESGLDMTGYRPGMVVLFSILGLLVGAALGYGADRLVDMIPSERKREKDRDRDYSGYNNSRSYHSQWSRASERRYNKHRF